MQELQLKRVYRHFKGDYYLTEDIAKDSETGDKKHGVKIIYGLEAYYYNDMDGNSAVIGKSKLPLDTEFVAFDIETTGLNALNDRMTEIGAQIFSGGNILKEFNTFVDPGMHIPAEITKLTGIRDSDVQGAPNEKEAMQMFIDFIGDRPIIAHNAHFDVGFMTAAANRNGLRFSPVFLDTLALSHWMRTNSARKPFRIRKQPHRWVSFCHR